MRTITEKTITARGEIIERVKASVIIADDPDLPARWRF